MGTEYEEWVDGNKMGKAKAFLYISKNRRKGRARCPPHGYRSAVCGVRRYLTASAAREAAPNAGDSSPRATSTMRTSLQCWGKAALAAASRAGPR